MTRGNHQRNVFAPWRTMSGWEFQLLRTLQTDVAQLLHDRTPRLPQITPHFPLAG
jgi:hypothetical protein